MPATLALAIVALASQTAPRDPIGGQTPGTLAAALGGVWVGTLEYRDVQTDKRVRLASILRVTPGPSGQSFTFRYIYDDPAKVIQSTSTVRIGEGTYTVSPEGEPSIQYRMNGMNKLNGGFGTLTLEGETSEDGRKVDVRTLIRVSAQNLSIRRDSRFEGTKQWKFASDYRYSRVQQPANQ
ncbi:MAG TPA: hypothetical protein VJ835_01000 [Fimbriimonadaceae bacterium]|nr:hypothetical protein [Fimbriimonadaceae bacterium]